MSVGGATWAVLWPVRASSQTDPASMPPQEGDVLVKRGDAASKPLTAADVPDGDQFVSAWPMAPGSGIVRNGSRLNEVMLIRVDRQRLGATPLADAAGGVLAYSALCTHAGCNVTTWIPEEGILSCDCHASEFSVREGGKVLGGPATRPLPPLPLKVDGDVLLVAKPFASVIRFDG